MKLARIPKGTFIMGAPKSEEGRDSNETQHSVTISQDYYLGVTEVTQGQYDKVMGTNSSYFQKRVIRASDSSMYPVKQVSWEDAFEFCEKLSDLPEEKKAGRVYRLPTEAEWEYACRAGMTTAYVSVTTNRSLASMRGLPRTLVSRRIPWDRGSPIHGGYTTCTETFMSGFRTGMGSTHVVR